MRLHHGTILFASALTLVLTACGEAKQVDSETTSSSVSMAAIPLSAATKDVDFTDFGQFTDHCEGPSGRTCMLFYSESVGPDGQIFHNLEASPTADYFGLELSRMSNVVAQQQITYTYWVLPARAVMDRLGIGQLTDVVYHQGWLADGLRREFGASVRTLGPQGH